MLYVNLYVASAAEIKMDNGRTVKMTQETRYPWEGSVKMTVKPDQPGHLALNVRIPGWARNEPVPSDLYQFADKITETPTVKVNGKPVAMQLTKGYVTIDRTWKSGDIVELNLPMPVRRVTANTQVDADKGRVALQRGPLVYTAEWVDNPNGKVRNLMLPDSAKLIAEYNPALLKGVTVIVKAAPFPLQTAADGKVQQTDQTFTAIPYYAWANRGRGQMMVWLPNSESTRASRRLAGNRRARRRRSPSPATVARIRRTSTTAKTLPPPTIPAPITIGGPRTAAPEWVEMSCSRSCGHRGRHADLLVRRHRPRRRPRARVVEVACIRTGTSGRQWKRRVPTPSMERNKYNVLTFKAVTTTALRLEIAGAAQRLDRHPGMEGEVGQGLHF